MTFKRPVIILIHSAKAVNLILTCFFIVVFLMWIFTPDRIDNIDKQIVEKYTKEYKLRYKSGINKINEGDITDGIKELEELLNDLKDIKKGDRLDHIKRKCMRKLVKELIHVGRSKRARILIEQWKEFDKNDIFSHLEYANLLIQNPDTREQGDKLLMELLKQYPCGLILKSFLLMKQNSLSEMSAAMSVLDDTDQTVSGLAQAYINYKKRRDEMLRHWRINWISNEEIRFDENNSKAVFPSWIDHNKISFSTSVPSYAYNIQVHPRVDNIMVGPKFILTIENKKNKLLLGGPTMESNLYNLTNDIFISNWHSNLLFTRKDTPDKQGKNIDGYFKARVFPLFFVHITDQKKAQHIEDLLRHMGKEKEAATFRIEWGTWIHYTTNFMSIDNTK